MPKKNYWIRSGAYTMLQRIAAFLFGFGSYFLLVRYFSIDDNGIWVLYTLVPTTVEMSRSAFIQNAFIKFFNEETINKRVLFTSSLVLNALSTVVFIVVLVILIPFLQVFWKAEIFSTLILWYCGVSVIMILFTQFNYLEQANHSFAGVFWSSVVRQGIFFAIVAVCYFFFPGLPLTFFAGSQFVTAFLGLLTSFLFVRKMLPSRLELEWGMVRKLFKFGKYILGTGITSTMGKNADQVILGNVSHGMAALYNAGIKILNFIEIPSLAISNIVYPKIAELASKEGVNSVGRLYHKSVGTILGFILPVIVFVLLFPEFVLMVTAGRQYLADAGALRIMALASVLIPFNIQIGSVCEVMNRPHVSFYINLFSNILNVVLNIILIRFFGILGAASAFAITIVFIFVIGQWYLNVKLEVRGFGAFSGVIDFYRNGFYSLRNYFKRADV